MAISEIQHMPLERPYLDPDRIRDALKSRRFGKPLYAFETIGSTNQVCWRLALDGYPEGTLVIAEEQTRGRGRQGRSWHSPPGTGLWFSVLLRPRGSAQFSWLLSLAMSLPVALTLRDLYRIDASVKWPNDVYVEGRKIAGVLVEGSVSGSRIDRAVVGVGVNVNQKEADFPEEIRATATSVRIATGRQVDRIALLAHLLVQMESVYEQLLRDETPVLEAWKERCVHLGKLVRVRTPQGLREGWFEDIAQDGNILLLTTDGQRLQVHAEDLTLLED